MNAHARSTALAVSRRVSWRLSWSAPFLGVMLAGHASAAFQPGGVDAGTFALASGLLAAAVIVGAAVALLPRWAVVIPPLLYVASVASLSMSDGGISSGLTALVLLAVVWTALVADLAAAVVVVAATVAAQVTVSLLSAAPVAADLRRLLLWSLLGLMTAIAIVSLRDRLLRAVLKSEERQRQSEVLTDAARALTAAQTAGGVLAVAVRFALALAPPETPFRAAYYRVGTDSMVSAVSEADATGAQLGESFPLEQHPFFAEIVTTRRPLVGSLADARLGPSVRRFATDAGLTTGMGAPVVINGRVDGILAVATRSPRIPAELFERFVALGQIVELAMGEIVARQRLSLQSITDQLTGIYNRRGLDDAVTHRGRQGFAFIAVDIDNLKAVNDTQGHRAGDAVIVATASALRDALRSGEVLARTGGDEFVVFIGGIGRQEAAHAAERLLDAVGSIVAGGVAPRVSIGVASGAAPADPERVLQRADQAMYAAKRAGGMRVVIA